MPDQPTILVTNVTVENITVSPGVVVDTAGQFALNFANGVLDRVKNILKIGA